jgi:hypothetical protein
VGENLQGSLGASTLFAGISLQVQTYRTNYAVGRFLWGYACRMTSVDACGGLQVLPYRDGLTGLIIPVRKNLSVWC